MLGQIFKSRIGDVDTVAKDVVGAIRVELGIFYRYVKVANIAAAVIAVAGDPVGFIALTGFANALVSTDLSDSDAQPICGGFLTGSVTGSLTVPQWTWVQLTGQVIVPTAVTTGVLGSGCMMATAANDKTLLVATGVIAPCATLISASGANNKVIANCPF